MTCFVPGHRSVSGKMHRSSCCQNCEAIPNPTLGDPLHSESDVQNIFENCICPMAQYPGSTPRHTSNMKMHFFFEMMCGQCLEWNAPLWFASLDSAKACDRVENVVFFIALLEQGVPESYCVFFRTWYCQQTYL